MDKTSLDMNSHGRQACSLPCEGFHEKYGGCLIVVDYVGNNVLGIFSAGVE